MSGGQKNENWGVGGGGTYSTAPLMYVGAGRGGIYCSQMVKLLEAMGRSDGHMVSCQMVRWVGS